MTSYAIRLIYTWTVEETFRPEHEALFEFHLHVMKRAVAWIETCTVAHTWACREQVAMAEVVADGSVATYAFEVPVQRSCWVAARIMPSSHTNPVFVVYSHPPRITLPVS